MNEKTEDIMNTCKVEIATNEAREFPQTVERGAFEAVVLGLRTHINMLLMEVDWLRLTNERSHSLRVGKGAELMALVEKMQTEQREIAFALVGNNPIPVGVAGYSPKELAASLFTQKTSLQSQVKALRNEVRRLKRAAKYEKSLT